jgi:outer membrane protein assembly factor BamA
MSRKFFIFTLLAVVALIASCSTTRVLQEGEERLAKNKIVITNDKSFSSNDLEPYIKQNPNSYFIGGWNPFLSVYNWQNGKGKGWDKFVKKIGVAPVVFDSTLVAKSEENISKHLEYLGYFESDVKSEIKIKKKQAYVKYLITLGKQYKIDEIRLNIPEGTFREAFYSDTTKMIVKKGSYLSENLLEEETVRSSAAMRNLGFYGFNKNYYFFEADTLQTPGLATLTLDINNYTRNESPSDAKPHRKYYINDVKISYPKSLKFRENIIKNLNLIVPGDVYSERKVNNTYNRLSSVRAFNSVNIEMTEIADTLVDCNISLTSSKLQGFKINGEASVNSTGLIGISPQISYYHKNIFRGGEWLSLGFMGNFQFRPKDNIKSNEFGVSAGLNIPRFLLLPDRLFKGTMPKTDVNISYNHQNRPEYTRNIISSSYGYQGNVNQRFYYQLYPMQLNIVNLFNLDENFYESLEGDPFLRNAYQNHFDLGIGGMIQYTTNSDIIPKSSYFYSRLQLDLAGNLLSAFKPFMTKDTYGAGMIWNTPFSQFVRSELTIGKTWVFGRNEGQAIATRLLGGIGIAYGNSSALPFEKHFYAGGSSSLRGWQARTVGPGLSQRDNSFVIPNQTGDMKLEANIEYRFDMFWKFAGAVFVDAGNIWTLEETSDDVKYSSRFTWNTFGQSLAANWGLGIRLDLDFLLLRIDSGFKLHDPAREQKWLKPGQWFNRNGYALHFGVGFPF